MENIFENAYFGKAYKTRDGRKALYQKDDKLGGLYHHWLITEDAHFACTDTGEQNMKMGYPPLDIVSEWTEETDEEELKENAVKSWNFLRSLCSAKSVENSLNNYVTGYINGYKIAKQENQ